MRLHSPHEPGELSQWFCHNDSTINIVIVVVDVVVVVIVVVMNIHL